MILNQFWFSSQIFFCYLLRLNLGQREKPIKRHQSVRGKCKKQKLKEEASKVQKSTHKFLILNKNELLY